MKSLATDERVVVSSKEGRRCKERGIEGLKKGRVKVLEIIEDDDFLVGRDVLNALVDHLAANDAPDEVDILIQQFCDGDKANPVAVAHFFAVHFADLIKAAKFVANLQSKEKEEEKQVISFGTSTSLASSIAQKRTEEDNSADFCLNEELAALASV